MVIKNISYADDPAGYERVLRENLSGENHTKDSLINFGVQIAIEAEKLKIEADKYREIAAKEVSSNMRVSQFLGMKSWDITKIADALEIDFHQPEIANILRRVSAKTKSTTGRDNANIRHAETNQRRDEIIKKYKSERQIYSSKDSAAEAYTKIYPLEFSVIRKYLRNI